ncbi:MAG: hypothetical protein AAFU71_14820 [Cyanobacteria bacterium J06632_22]
MSLFGAPTPKVSAAQLQQLKVWVYESLALSPEVSVSISQLRCTEPGCSPIETVIAVMTQPPETYKIHAPASDLTQQDVARALGRDQGTSC